MRELSLAPVHPDATDGRKRVRVQKLGDELVLGRDPPALLSLSPERDGQLLPGLLPITLEPDGESISVGRLSYGISEYVVNPLDLNQISRKAITLELKDGKLYLQNVGSGEVRVMRKGTALFSGERPYQNRSQRC